MCVQEAAVVLTDALLGLPLLLAEGDEASQDGRFNNKLWALRSQLLGVVAETTFEPEHDNNIDRRVYALCCNWFDHLVTAAFQSECPAEGHLASPGSFYCILGKDSFSCDLQKH